MNETNKKMKNRNYTIKRVYTGAYDFTLKDGRKFNAENCRTCGISRVNEWILREGHIMDCETGDTYCGHYDTLEEIKETLCNL